MFKRFIYPLAAGVLLLAACEQKKENPMNKTELTMLIGTYTDREDKGLYSFRFNQETAECAPLSEAKASNPSYLTISDDNKFVYVVNEDGGEEDAVSAFSFNVNKGTMKYLNQQPSGGVAPCYIVSNGKNVVTANYGGGSISVLPIRNDGTLSPAADVIRFSGSGADPARQGSPHLHCVRFSPDGKCLFATDLGTDRIYKYEVNQSADYRNGEKFLREGMPHVFKLSLESGPRHLTFSPNGDRAYLINELSGAVMTFSYSNGKLDQLQSVQADTVSAKGSADIHISPDGKFLYASNRLEADGMAIFRIDENGLLAKAGYQLTGKHPRNFIITPNGKYILVACRDKNAVEVYERNPKTGLLKNTGKDISLNKPVCIKFAH